MSQVTTSSKKRILVIDDETAIVTYLTVLLQDHGYETISANDGKAGKELARKQAPDLICLDIMMPKQSGITLYKDLKSDPELKSIPVVFVSAFNQVHDLNLPEYFRKMVTENIPEPKAYIEKPIKAGEFVETVISIIGTSSSANN